METEVVLTQSAGRVLVVEDDADLREVMVATLTSDGHAVAAARNADGALDRLAAEAFDLVLLDLTLGPGADGVDVCRRMRAAGIESTHVLVLTARGTEADIVLALEAGADDYVTKPIGVVELRSRVRAVLRRLRPPGAGAAAQSWGRLLLDPGRRTVHCGDDPVSVTFSEFEVLRALLAADGSLCTRPQLLEAIFGDARFRDPRAIDVHVHHLREKLTAAGVAPDAIITVRGAGYRLAR